MHIVCAHCLSTNRVPPERTDQDPKCGRCGEALLPQGPIELDDARLERVLAKTELPVLIDFWAPWCGPCQAFAPQFQQAAAALRGKALLVKVNSDDNPKASVRYRVRSIPTLLKLSGGQEVARQVGALSAAEVVRWALA